MRSVFPGPFTSMRLLSSWSAGDKRQPSTGVDFALVDGNRLPKVGVVCGDGDLRLTASARGGSEGTADSSLPGGVGSMSYHLIEWLGIMHCGRLGICLK